MPRLAGVGRRRFPVAGRLALVLCGLAVFSTGFTLFLQDRVLDRDLRRSAHHRLERSAQAADHLLRAHLRSVAERYVAVSRTPEFRANIAIDHTPTLVFFAEQLRRNHGAALVAFQGPGAETIARSGDDRLALTLPRILQELADAAQPACVEVAAETGRQERDHAGGPLYVPCQEPSARVQATLAVVDEAPYSIATIPLVTGSQRVGQLLIADAIRADVLESWSRLCGARVRIGRAAPDPIDPEDIDPVAARFPSGELWISAPRGTERAALHRFRRNLLFSGLLTLAAAFSASLGLARSLSRPLRGMQEATRRIGRGDLSIRLRSRRHDELGDLSRALDSMLDRLDETHKRLRRVQQLARFGEWTVHFDTAKVEGSPEFQRALGIPEAASVELLLPEMLERIHAEDRGRLRREIDRCRHAELSFEVQVRVPFGPENRVLRFRGRSQAVGSAASRLEGSVEDLTEQKRVEEQIRHLTYHSSVTGLPNMRFFRERLLQSCRRARREPFCVALIGLDHFQVLNETHGHSFGDAVLQATARRLLAEFPTDPGGDTSKWAIAHLGADEFGVVLEGVSNPEAATEVTEILLDRISQPHAVLGEEIVITASIGICLGGAEATPEDLLRDCDSALRRAKDLGRHRFEFFDAVAREETTRRLRIESGLRRALDDDRLKLLYQPRISTHTGSVVCFEALLRWTDDELGPVPPSEFIPIAEQSGLIQAIGSRALVGALEQLRRWSEAGYEQAKVSINLSPHQFHRGIDEEIREHLQGLDPQKIELEVTEYALLRDEGAAIGALRRLREAGFRVSLDDFGTGYSSLSYLRKLPIDAVKLDRSFVEHIDSDPAAAQLTASIIAMVRALRLNVVAEGVETGEQREILVEMCCDELQGFHFSPAVPADATLQLLDRPPAPKARGSSRRRNRRWRNGS